MQKLADDKLADSVEKHLRTDFTTLQLAQTVGEALERLRSEKLAEKIVYFYVLDGQRLVGVVPTRRLLMSAVEQPISEIMVTRVISIPRTMTVLDACEFFVMYRLLAFPVVDEQDRLIGVIDVGLFTDEIFGVTERQSAEDVFQLIGVHIMQGRHSNPWLGFRDRFPWLLCNIAGGIGYALIVGRYERFLDSVIVLALFIPVVLTLAEAVSMQSMTITMQMLREQRMDWRLLARSLRMEFLTSLLLGFGSGLLVGSVALAWKRHGAVALAIGASVWFAVVTACVLGVLLPMIVRAFKGDPKIAAGPVVLAASDIATVLFYFNLSAAMLG